MNKPYKSTEFSVHLSRSKMRHYLNDTLTPIEKQQVELHLKHCVHCSNIIVDYIENEETEHYKVHMAKLKNKLTSSVKSRKPKFTSGRIKIIRAAAAVAALFVFSFFALGSMAKKDFNLISDAGKKGNALPELKASQKSTQRPKAVTSLPTEQKIDEVGALEIDMDDDEMEEKPVVAAAKPKVQAAVSKPKESEQKQEETIKTASTVKVVEKTSPPSSPVISEAAAEKKENDIVQEEEKVAEKAAQGEQEEKADVAKTVKPVQKIEKIDAGTQNNVIPEAQNIQTIPTNGVGQLRER